MGSSVLVKTLLASVLLCVGCGGGGEREAQRIVPLRLPSLQLLAGSTVAELRCLLLLVSYDSSLSAGTARRCSLSDGTSVTVDHERAVELSGNGPFEVRLTLKKVPFRLTVVAMDSAALAEIGEICSNQSIAALPHLPIYRVGASASTVAADASSVELLLTGTQELGALPLLQECS